MKYLLIILALSFGSVVYSQSSVAPASAETNRLEERKKELENELRKLADRYYAELAKSDQEIERLQNGSTGSIAAIKKQNLETEKGINNLTD